MAKIEDGPVYLKANVPENQRVEAFNARPHPQDMSPEAREQEARLLCDAPVPHAIFVTRLVELANRDLNSFINPANTVDSIAAEARSGTRMTVDPLRMLAPDELRPVTPAPLGELRFPPKTE